MKYAIKNTDNDQFYSVLQSNNGKTISTSKTVGNRILAYKNICSQIKGHCSKKPIKVVDLTAGVSYMLRLVNNRVEKFNEKKYISKKK